MTVDDFLANFGQWREMADCAEYGDVMSPVDGVIYPGICVLDRFDETIGRCLRRALGRVCVINHLFMRLSLEGNAPPHWAHHDGSMGEYSLMLYMNRAEHCRGGTALLSHRDGEIDQETWARDTNERDKWFITSMCHMEPNRAFIFRSDLWHAAMPASGFGSNAKDGRLVLTAFFQ